MACQRLQCSISFETNDASHMCHDISQTIGLLDASYNTSYTRHFLKHAPFVYHKSVFASLAEWYRQPLEHTSASRFRDWNDVITPLLHHYTVIAEQRPEWPFEVRCSACVVFFLGGKRT